MNPDEGMTCICEGCGICTKMEREIVFLKDDTFSIISDENARCEACNSYDDGSTLKIFSPLLKKIKTDIYRELQHRHEINLECAREAGRLSMLEEIGKLMTENNVHGFCVTKKELEELKQRGAEHGK